MSKLALIIGNADYPESPLSNPVNDARAIKHKLTNLGFKTITITNAKNISMEKALRKFSTRLVNQEVALFFFAGHGMQIDGKNYLTAVDTNFDQEIDAKHSSLPLNKVIDIMERGPNKTDIIMLDACRTNPYERRWRGEESRGLAPVYAPKGMIIAYATSPGQVAYDGDGKNGAYTDAFLRHVGTPDITIEDLFKRVRNTLSSSTRGRQISWEHTSLMGDFYFNFSFVTDELIAEYGNAVIADEDYRPTSGDEAHDIIAGLKSHDWYKQNPAIKQIRKRTLDNFTKDELFALGRNIYQAACGSANQAIGYMENLQNKLSSLDDSVAFHILNGMLFEIYFDSHGQIRDKPKTKLLDEVFRLEEHDDNKESFRFIRQALTPYLKGLFYIPSSVRGIAVDVLCTKHSKKETVINAVYFEGDNILYDEQGVDYFDPDQDDFMCQKTKKDLRKTLSETLATPSYRLTVNYIGADDNTNKIMVPYTFNVKRLA